MPLLFHQIDWWMANQKSCFPTKSQVSFMYLAEPCTKDFMRTTLRTIIIRQKYLSSAWRPESRVWSHCGWLALSLLRIITPLFVCLVYLQIFHPVPFSLDCVDKEVAQLIKHLPWTHKYPIVIPHFKNCKQNIKSPKKGYAFVNLVSWGQQRQ